MHTSYDFVTVACFLGLVGVYFFYAERRPQILRHLIVSAVVFAVANQVGNAGMNVLAIVLILAGIAYAGLIVRS